MENYEHGIALLEPILRENPRLADGWSRLGLANEKLGRTRETAACYRKAIEAAPALSSELAMALTTVLVKLKEFEPAKAQAALVSRANPAAARQLDAQIARGEGRLEDAARAAELSMANPSYRYPSALLLSEILHQQGKLQEALDTLDRVERDMGVRGVAPIEGMSFARGDILARMNRQREAEAAFRQEIESFPHHLQAYRNLAFVYTLQGRVPERDRLVAELIRENPTDRGYGFAVELWEKMGEPRRAAELRRQGVLR